MVDSWGRRRVRRQLTPADVDAIWAQFEQYEPTHAANARALVRGGGASGAQLLRSSKTGGLEVKQLTGTAQPRLNTSPNM